MSTQRVINNTLQSEMLESGQQLGAAGTSEAVRTDVRLSQGDHDRLVRTGKVTVVIDDPVEADAPAPAEAVPSARSKRAS